MSEFNTFNLNNIYSFFESSAYHVVDIQSHVAKSGAKLQSKYLILWQHLDTNSDLLLGIFKFRKLT